jgi:hypothetical protein
MTFTIKQGNRTRLLNQNLLDTSMFVEDDSMQGSLFTETATLLSEMFFSAAKETPGPDQGDRGPADRQQ